MTKKKQPAYVTATIESDRGVLTKLNPTVVVIAAWVLVRSIELYAIYQTRHPVGGWTQDIGWYNFWASGMNAGHFPVNDPMWQYPPLAAVVFLASFALSHGSLGFVSLAIVADAAIMALLLYANKRQTKARSLGLWIWVAAPVLMGPLMLGRFDLFPTVAIVAALVFAGVSESFGSLVAIGALLKVWPILALIGTPRKNGIRSLMAFAISFGVGTGIMMAWWPGSFEFLSNQKDRGLQIESLGAWPYMLWNSMGHHVSQELRYGAIEVVAQGTQTVCLIVNVTCIALLALLALLRLVGRLEHASTAHITLTAVLVSLVTSRVLSPQYTVWSLGLIAITAIDPPRYFRPIAGLVCTSAFAGNLLYPANYIQFESGDKFAMFIQTVRVMTLLAATIISFFSLLERPSEDKSAKTTVAQTKVKAKRQGQARKA